MAIVTISRGSYSRGKEVAEKLAHRLGYECISRDILLQASEEFNIPEIKLIRAIHDAPLVLERFTHGKKQYISYFRSALLHHVQRDNVVYHGLAGHFFLQKVPHVLKVRIIADIEDRVKEEMRRENILAKKALYILKKDDEERRKWSLQVTGMDAWDSRNYDIVLHIGILTVEDAIDILYETIKKSAFQTTKESQKMIDDLALSAKVQAHLVKNYPNINVLADNGKIYIKNIESGLSLKDLNIKKIENIIKKIEGVKEVMFYLPSTYPQTDHVNPFHNID